MARDTTAHDKAVAMRQRIVTQLTTVQELKSNLLTTIGYDHELNKLILESIYALSKQIAYLEVRQQEAGMALSQMDGIS